MSKSESVRTDFLEDKVVSVKYITKETNGIQDPKHVAYGGLLNGASITIPAPTLDNRKMKNILTNDEKKGLEHILGLDLSIYGRFWKEDGKAYELGILPIKLTKEEKRYNLSDPYDFIKVKVLQSSPIVANSLNDIGRKATYRFVLTSESEKLQKELDKAGYKINAYKLFVKYENDADVLRYTLRNLGRNTSRNHKLEFLQSEFHKELEKNPSLIVSVLGDSFIKTKVLLETCFEFGAVARRDKSYYTLDDEPISESGIPTLQNAAEFLASNLGQDMRLGLEAKLKLSRK
jgi:hypothetical protein